MMSKRAALLNAEREYWNCQRRLREQSRQLVDAGIAPEISLPADVSSVVWGLRDGAAFVRHKAFGPPGVGFRVWDITLQEWGTRGLIVPTSPAEEISLALAGAFRGVGHFSLVNCQVSGIDIPYVEFSVMRYGDTRSLPSVEQAVADFQLAFLGQLFQIREGATRAPIEQLSVLAKLEEVAAQFEQLLAANEVREEELQQFIRANPLVIHPSAKLVPKQKLGEDFVTDFVLVAPSDQGPTYYLVEIERATLPVFVKDGALSAQANHAIKQTRDWDIWLEENQDYLKRKLDGFESPQYIIIIGRGSELSLREKAHLRSYNRGSKDTKLLTYDDLLAQFRATIARIREATGQCPSSDVR